MISQALVPQLILSKKHTLICDIVCIGVGITLLALLAQIHVYLPWTPVPITGQTFGVALVSLSWGRSRGVATVFSYFALGSLGLPIFANGASGLIVCPTMGYRIGMVLASFVMGYLADKGWTLRLSSSLAAAFLGSVFVFACGLAVLSFFVPQETLMMSGVIPFLPGDIIKNILAAGFAHIARIKMKRN